MILCGQSSELLSLQQPSPTLHIIAEDENLDYLPEVEQEDEDKEEDPEPQDEPDQSSDGQSDHEVEENELDMDNTHQCKYKGNYNVLIIMFYKGLIILNIILFLS